MKPRVYSSAIAAGVLALFAFSHDASATTVAINSQDTTTLPTMDYITTPLSFSTGFILSTTNSQPGAQLSPWATDYTDQTTTAPFSVLDSTLATQANPADAIYNLAPGATSFSVLWGSPDSYNSIEFFSGLGGSGLIGTYTGSDLSGTPGTGFDLVSFLASDGTIGSVEFLDYGEAAFEYSNVNVSGSNSLPTPLPAALPLFAGGLAMFGLIGGRRKRKNAAALAA
jgi:hypothetical protein